MVQPAESREGFNLALSLRANCRRPTCWCVLRESKMCSVFVVVKKVGSAGTGDIKGTMAFDRKEFGMNSGIPFIKIADRVEVTVDLKGKRVSGPPLVFKQ